jgi:integrase/recombinase XerD
MEPLPAAALQLAKELPMTILRQRMTEDMQMRNLSPHTQASYLQQVSLFARHFDKSPGALGPERAYQLYLTNEKKLAPGSIHIAVAALRFLYKVTLKKDWTFEDVLPLPKKPQKLPVVLSPEEVVHFLGCVDAGKHRVILTTCYAAGLRVSEAVRLKAAAIDNRRMVIRVEQGKGRKDRYVMLSPKLLEGRAPEGLAAPGRSPGPTDHERGCRRRLSKGTSMRRPLQGSHAAFAAPRLRGTFARIRHRSAHHSAAARSS